MMAYYELTVESTYGQPTTLWSEELIDANALYELGVRHAQQMSCPSIVNDDYFRGFNDGRFLRKPQYRHL